MRLGRRDSAPALLSQSVQILCPCLHHLAALLQALRPVVRCTHLVALLVRQLQLNQIGVAPVLVQEGAGERRKPGRRYLLLGVPQAAQGTIERVLAASECERDVAISTKRQQLLCAAVEIFEAPQPGAARLGKEEEATLVVELIGLLVRLGPDDRPSGRGS
jgi:hypothetical protein